MRAEMLVMPASQNSSDWGLFFFLFVSANLSE
jgi:hypothetical protein